MVTSTYFPMSIHKPLTKAQDHVLVAPTLRVNLETSSKLAADPNFRLRAIQEFNENGTGILSAPGSGFIGTQNPPLTRIQTDIQTRLLQSQPRRRRRPSPFRTLRPRNIP